MTTLELRHEIRLYALGYATASLGVAWLLPDPFLRWAVAGGLVLASSAALECDAEKLKLAAVLPLAMIAAGVGNTLLAGHLPYTIDAQLLRCDFGIAAAVENWTISHTRCHLILQVVYDALPLVLGVNLFGSNRRGLIRALALSILLAVPCYAMFPAVGPAHVGDIHAARNCMPSIHLTWALLFWFYAPRWLRWPLAAFVLLTAVATLGLGEHYALDLIAAVPFTALIIKVIND